MTGLLLTFSGFGQVAFADTASTISVQPKRVGTVAAWIFNQVTKKENGTFINVVSGDRYWNTTKDNISLTSSFTGSHTNGSSVSVSLGGGWGPINATDTMLIVHTLGAIQRLNTLLFVPVIWAGMNMEWVETNGMVIIIIVTNTEMNQAVIGYMCTVLVTN